MTTMTLFGMACLLAAYAAGLLWASHSPVVLTPRDLRLSAGIVGALACWCLGVGVFG